MKIALQFRNCMYTSSMPHKDEYPVLLNVWESSVRATHHFLREGDVDVFKRIIQEKEVFSHVNLLCAKDMSHRIAGFMGTSADSLEMLFVHADFIGRGVGKLLLRHAFDKMHITEVDVNEQNERAWRFYEHFGFKTMSRSAFDGTGKPYPILHLQLV